MQAQEAQGVFPSGRIVVFWVFIVVWIVSTIYFFRVFRKEGQDKLTLAAVAFNSAFFGVLPAAVLCAIPGFLAMFFPHSF
jgi:hypothetical protein